MTRRLSLTALACLSAGAVVTGCYNHINLVRDAGPGDAAIDGGEPDAALHVHSLEIAPANPVLDCGATTMTEQLSAVAVLDDGTRLPTTGSWSLQTPHLGTITSDGVFHARDGCIASGTATVTVAVTDSSGVTMRATTDIAVRVSRPAVLTGFAPGVDPGAHFGGVEHTSMRPSVLYPLDGALLPNNVLPLDIQWDTGNAGDIYEVTMSNVTLSLTAYVLNTGGGFTFSWMPDRELWRLVAENYSNEGIHIIVSRWDSVGDFVVKSDPTTIRLTRSSIAGHVYYWDVAATLASSGKIFRINAFDGTRSDVIPTPEPEPSTGIACVGCHSISPNGRYMAVMLGGGDPNSRGTVFDLSTDLSGPSPPSLFPAPWDDSSMLFRFASATWNPDSTQVLWSGPELHLLDPQTGAPLTADGLALGMYYGVAWSPDGTLIAMGSMLDGVTWFDRYTNGDLVVMPVLGSTSFGPISALHAGSSLVGAPEGGSADSHPSWSPDSQLIAFQHGTNDRSDNAVEDASYWASCSLYMIPRGGGAAVHLDNAVLGSPMPRNYWPSFSPFVSHENDGLESYYWLAFTSGRPYGNAQDGTATTPRRQIWVTAIKAGVAAGNDPSSVPYWLPGQDLAGENVAGQWAPVACTATGDSCHASSECCSGNCASVASGYTCQPPPASECHATGGTCGGIGECCDGLVCAGNTCVPG